MNIGELYIWNDGHRDYMVMIVPSKNGVANWVGWCEVLSTCGTRFRCQKDHLKPINENGHNLSFTKSEQPIIIIP